MKRANGTGSVQQLPSGKWRTRVMIAGKRVSLGTYETEMEARAVLAAWMQDRAAGEIVTGSELPLGTYGEAWLNRREVSGSRKRERVRSIASERSVWRCQVMTSKLAEIAITDVRPRDIDAFAIELRERKARHATTFGRDETKRVVVVQTRKPLSRSQQREALRLVRGALDDAKRAEIITTNPADGATVAPGSARPRDLREDWLRWPEVEQLLACEAIPRRDRRAYACAIGLALRVDDLRAIEISRVDLDCQVPGPGISVWIAKSERWHRVPIMPWLSAIVREQLASLPRGARYLFPREDGGRYSKSHDYGWAEHRERLTDRHGKTRLRRRPGALEVAGVARRVRFHDLRGSCATHLALGTWGRVWSMHEIQSMLAHSDQRVTERYVRRAADALALAARETPGPGCPPLPMAAGSDLTKVPRKQGAPGTGLEPVTNRLTAPGSDQQDQALTPARGQPVGNETLRALAAEVIRLAVDGNPHVVGRAVELADAVLDATSATSEREGVA